MKPQVEEPYSGFRGSKPTSHTRGTYMEGWFSSAESAVDDRFGMTLEEAAVRISHAFGACRHSDLVEVRSAVDGELLAYLCRDCDRQLEGP